VRAADVVGGRDQRGEARAVGLVQPAVGLWHPVPVERVGVELAIGARAVLVGHVEVAVRDERVRGEQVVGFVAGVVRAAEGVQADGRRVCGEEDGEHRRRAAVHRLS
jgi:hypothetical protein